MNWFDLLDALLIGAAVFAVLLRLFDRLTGKRTLGTLTVVYLALAASAFVQGEPWAVGISTVCTAVFLVLLWREHRKDTAARTAK
ncbi:hypothetical protein ACFWGI_35590 [Streptomyces niveus]|uniref:hypothetical protein n=1 Tax=Streptomyces niveus TaxID=193462 RepID=UPI0036628DD0